MLSYKTIFILFVAFLSIVCVSCVRDTDFGQRDDVEIRPVVELNLIYFDVAARQFFDTISNTPILTVRDTTALEFLDGQDIADALQRVEFYFKFDNEIPRDFSVTFDFLSEDNITTYTMQTLVSQGVPGQIQTTLFEPVLEGVALDQLTLANKVVANVTIPSADASLSGNLNLQSKAIYFLEID